METEARGPRRGAVGWDAPWSSTGAAARATASAEIATLLARDAR